MTTTAHLTATRITMHAASVRRHGHRLTEVQSVILNKFNLKGNVALVTGASRGLGQGMALALAEAGADVALVARTKSSLEETALSVEKAGSRGFVVQADLSRTGEVLDGWDVVHGYCMSASRARLRLRRVQ